MEREYLRITKAGFRWERRAVYAPAPIGKTGKRGRPRIHPDRKAYLAHKARERRAKLKAAATDKDQP